MKNYKEYLLRQLGIKESQFPASIVERNAFPGIDPEELEMGSEDEKAEHGMSNSDAERTATQHLKQPDQKHYYSGMEKAKDAGMLKDMVSPTAIKIPIIGVSVRGSSSGGLPSGVDRMGDISPSKLGGYEKISVETANSKLVDKTPTNPQINSGGPIAKDTTTVQGGDQHPHQVQKNSGQPPQSTTGASTDSNNQLTLKSAMPKSVDIDVFDSSDNNTTNNTVPTSEFGKDDDGEPRLGMNETFARHSEMMKSKLNIKECTCKCGDSKCDCKCKTDECKDCGCKKLNTTHDLKESTTPKYSTPFERMRGLANIGNTTLSSNGTWNTK